MRVRFVFFKIKLFQHSIFRVFEGICYIYYYIILYQQFEKEILSFLTFVLHLMPYISEKSLEENKKK